MSNPKVFRLPVTEKWDGPMATPLPWYTRLWRRLRRRKPTWNAVIFDRARRGR